jgi:hypothetical protein
MYIDKNTYGTEYMQYIYNALQNRSIIVSLYWDKKQLKGPGVEAAAKYPD